MKFKCAQGCKTKHKRIAVVDHCFEEKHRLIIETTNRGRKTKLSAEILTHEQEPHPGYSR